MSFFRYPGGKSKLRDQIVSCLRERAISTDLQYREPFFGGGSIGLNLLNYSNIQNIWINDKDVGIACLWTSVIRYPDILKSFVSKYIPTVASFYDLKTELSSLSLMSKEKEEIANIGFKKLVIHQISYSGLGTMSGGPLGGEKQLSVYKIDCRWSPKYICKKIDILHSKFSKMNIQNNMCTNNDFEELVKQKDKALIYLDPPYYEKGGELYQHSFEIEDHERLANCLKECKHSWVLSYDDCEEVRNLYEWADFRIIDVKYSITATKDEETGERASTTKPELLIYSKENTKFAQNAYLIGTIFDVAA